MRHQWLAGTQSEAQGPQQSCGLHGQPPPAAALPSPQRCLTLLNTEQPSTPTHLCSCVLISAPLSYAWNGLLTVSTVPLRLHLETTSGGTSPFCPWGMLRPSTQPEKSSEGIQITNCSCYFSVTWCDSQVDMFFSFPLFPRPNTVLSHKIVQRY